MTTIRTLALITALTVFAAPRAAAQLENVPDGFMVETIVTMSDVIDFAFLPDGRCLLANKANGQIRLWVPANGAATTLVGSVPSVQDGAERGLMSICIDPDFVTNGYFYTYSSRTTTNNMVLARFTITGDLNVATSTNLSFATSSQFTLLSNIPDNAFNHNGGTVRFGPDGMLYLSIGDDANSCSAQTRTDMRGVLLRMDVSSQPAGGGTASIATLNPGDNPFSGSANTNERLVIAWGLRNPFSYNIDPITGDLFIADVGLGTREEYNQFVRNLGGSITARNFGWPMREGFASGPQPGCAAQTGLTDPIDDRIYGSGGTSIMSVGMYRNLGGAFDWGPSYEGDVFHCDYLQGGIERLTWNGSSWVSAAPVSGQPSPTYWGTGFSGVTHYGLGPDGSIYFADLTGNTFKRIRAEGPVNEFTAISGTGQVGVLGGTFAAPVVLELRDPMGTPLAGETVSLGLSSNANFVGAAPTATDANGRVSVMIEAVGGGNISLTATTPGGAVAGQTFNLFARALGMNVIPTSQWFVICTFTNTSNGASPVPFLFAMTEASRPIYPTEFGLLGIDLFTLTDTVIIEDPQGLIDGTQYQGGLGTPSKTNVYQVPLPLLFGTLRFQAIWLDPSTPTSILNVTPSAIGFSNIVTQTF